MADDDELGLFAASFVRVPDAAVISKIFETAVELGHGAAANFMSGILAIPEAEPAEKPDVRRQPAPADVNACDPARPPTAVTAQLAFHFCQFSKIGSEHGDIIVVPGSVVIPAMDVNHDQQAIGRIFAGESVEHGVHLFAAPKPALVIELN